MLKKISFFAVTAFVLLLSSCGPAAEDRTTMVSRSKIVQDSIANSIKMAIQEAEMPATTQAPAVIDTTKK